MVIRRKEYEKFGDYHKKIDITSHYYPTFISKMRFIRNFINNNIHRHDKVLDVGCGEGILVREYCLKGYNFFGIDLNYAHDRILIGSVLGLPFKENVFRLVIFTDVIEHINLCDQQNALEEIKRILMSDGYLLISFPNLAHFRNRIKFLLKGKLPWSASYDEGHLGERPNKEFFALLVKSGFKIIHKRGITLTVPLIKLVYKNPKNFLWLHNLLDKLNLVNLSYINIVIAQKQQIKTCGKEK